MFRYISLSLGLAASLLFSGCACYSGVCGPTPGVFECNNCDGYSPMYPGNNVQRLGGRLACGSGCGEYYVDEWSNYRPDPCNPCDTRSCGLGGFGGIGLLMGQQFHQGETCYGGDGIALGHLGSRLMSCGCCNNAGCDDCASSGGCSSCGSGNCGGGCGLPVSARATTYGGGQTEYLSAQSTYPNKAYANTAYANKVNPNRTPGTRSPVRTASAQVPVRVSGGRVGNSND